MPDLAADMDGDLECAFCSDEIGTPVRAHGKVFCSQRHADNYAAAEKQKADSFKGY